jgi:large subunit ribosomal protein L17
MRHRVVKVKLNRSRGHRKALLKNMSASLIEHERIETTLPKAKSLRPYVEKLVTRAKVGSDFNTLRYLRRKLFSEEVIKKLVEEIAPKFKNRKGGYTRIVRVRNRDGDNTVMAVLEFVGEKKTEKTVKKDEETAAEDKKELKTKEEKKDKPKSDKKPEAKKAEKKETKKEEKKKPAKKAAAKKETKKVEKKVNKKKDEK